MSFTLSARLCFRPFVVLLAAAALLAGSHSVARAQTVDPDLWVTDGPVYSIVRVGGTIYIGGDFDRVGPATGGPGTVTRYRLAAIDAATGAATEWNPRLIPSAGVEFSVRAIVVSGSTVYVGGSFGVSKWDTPDGIPRRSVAAFDAATGTPTNWNPYADAMVRALAVNGSTVYAGGDFLNIGGQARIGIAALDATTGAATAWNPNPNDFVRAMVTGGSTVYVGGAFSSIGGQVRFKIAALDATTGAATDWNPGANNTVHALALSSTTIYAGGFFTSIGGEARSGIAAVDAASGAVTAWDPNANLAVHCLAVNGPTVYAGGDFGTIGGRIRSRVAALDAETGAAIAWNPGANNTVDVLAVSGSTIYAGGDFTSIGGVPRGRIAAIGDATTDVDPVRPLSLRLDIRPNPIRAAAQIGFGLHADGPVTVDLVDVAGRQVAVFLRDQTLTAGWRAVEFRPSGLAAGLYFVRLRAGREMLSSKVVVGR